jgi:hypothetical protein
MPTAKKCASPKKGCAKPKAKRAKISESMLQEFVQHKSSVLVIMVAVMGLGALFAMMMGASAANF